MQCVPTPYKLHLRFFFFPVMLQKFLHPFCFYDIYTLQAVLVLILFEWMVDAVKVSILHLQLKAFNFLGGLLANPTLKSGSNSDSGKPIGQISYASFGSEESLVGLLFQMLESGIFT